MTGTPEFLNRLRLAADDAEADGDAAVAKLLRDVLARNAPDGGNMTHGTYSTCPECGHPVMAVDTPVAEVPSERASQHDYVEYEHTGEAICHPCGHVTTSTGAQP